MKKLYVIKIGGNIVDDPNKLSTFLQDFASIAESCILVHGGGKMATSLAEEMGIEQAMVNGRRITDSKTLDIVTMVYAGLINKNIVADLQALSCNALGFCGADGNFIQSHKRTGSEIDYGFVGDVDLVASAQIASLISAGFTLVFSAITHNKQGQLLNTNADTIAQELATALTSAFETTLVYCFEKEGVLLDVNDDSSVINHISGAYFEELKSENKIFAGMLPKLENAFSAVSKGIHGVIIGKAEKLKDLISGKAGTLIR